MENDPIVNVQDADSPVQGQPIIPEETPGMRPAGEVATENVAPFGTGDPIDSGLPNNATQVIGSESDAEVSADDTPAIASKSA